ncbi:hypothetical protein DFH08DRAFT_877747 [Mycena albidolilacea]|uniref:Uncharacterized protein n=1 Tax=Mycena albidolilacea TaxID=1033008 RepID=A0AAD6ZTR2_9AGAR|nr:hypothetical protein DFH08DRAFT_877747 [Mycena albidolilacea]
MLALRMDFPPASTCFAFLVFPTADSAQPSNVKADLAKAVMLIACLFSRKHSSLHLPDTLNTLDTSVYLCTYISHVDSDYGLGDKDVLPAYDGRDWPPNYVVAAAAARRQNTPIVGAASAVGPLQGLATSLVSSSVDNVV